MRLYTVARERCLDCPCFVFTFSTVSNENRCGGMSPGTSEHIDHMLITFRIGAECWALAAVLSFNLALSFDLMETTKGCLCC